MGNSRYIYEPLAYVRQSLQLSFLRIHGFLGQFDARLIRRGHQFDDRVRPFPRHGTGKLDHGIHRIQEGAIPVTF